MVNDYDDDLNDESGIDADDRDANYYERAWGGPDDDELDEDWDEDDEGLEEYDDDWYDADADEYFRGADEYYKRQQAEAEFVALMQKYQVEAFPSKSLPNKLYAILLKLESNEDLDEHELRWLRIRQLLGPYRFYAVRTATKYERLFQESKDPWNLAKASSFWRMAEQPNRALAATEACDATEAGQARARCAILTTRGGAYRDLKDLARAETCGQQAISLHGKDYHPFMLLGAVCYQAGRFEEGDRHFDRAIKLGAKPSRREAMIRESVELADTREQQAAAHFLLQKDPVKYSWAKQYLQGEVNSEE